MKETQPCVIFMTAPWPCKISCNSTKDKMTFHSMSTLTLHHPQSTQATNHCYFHGRWMLISLDQHHRGKCGHIVDIESVS